MSKLFKFSTSIFYQHFTRFKNSFIRLIFIFSIFTACSQDIQLGSLILNFQHDDVYSPFTSINILLSGPANKNINREVNSSNSITIDSIEEGKWTLFLIAKRENKTVGTAEKSINVLPNQTVSYEIKIFSSSGSYGTGQIAEEIVLTKRSDIEAYITGTKYYLDAYNGNDITGKGTSNNPWKSLSKVQYVLKAGDAVILRDGNYGKFDCVTAYNNWVVYINEDGAKPVFTNISIIKMASNPILSLNLIFYGIKVLPAVVPQTINPQFIKSTLSTYNKTPDPINIYYAGSIRFYNCEISGYNKHLTGGIYLNYTSNIIIERCNLHKMISPITYINSTNTKFVYNYIHEICASAFKDGGNNLNTLIEGNHAHDMNWNYAEDWCPRASGATYHGSLVVISSSSLTIRNNILHDGGITGGIYFYGGYPASNILIENNLLYDIHNSAALLIADSGKNIIIRNNIIACRGRYGNTAHYKYEVAFTMYKPYSGYDSSDVSVYNNIFVGVTNFYDYNNINEGNNICWVAWNNGTTLLQSSMPTSKLVYGYESGTYFDYGFFTDDLNRSWYYWDMPIDTWHQYTLSSPGHQQLLNFALNNSKDAVNFGDPTKQANDSLGTLHESGFIQKDGKERNIDHHSAGCYEIY